jgi:hypothetical protein
MLFLSLRLRTIVSAISLLCVVLASVMIRARPSHALSKNKPSVELRASRTSIIYPCPPGQRSSSGSCPSGVESQVRLTTIVKDFSKQHVVSYSVTAGQIVGEGNEVTWDLTGVWPGFYNATVEARDKTHRSVSSLTVTVVRCSDCFVSPDLPCGTITVNCYDQVRAGTPITCKVVMFGIQYSPITYEWSVRDSEGQHLSEKITRSGEYISIPTNDLAGRTVYVTVDFKGLDPSCNTTASGSTKVRP